VITYDNRGTGRSEGPMDDLTIADLAEDAAAVLRAADAAADAAAETIKTEADKPLSA
jgi:pimeloyl-ACP methyl ester carboxylesterase